MKWLCRWLAGRHWCDICDERRSVACADNPAHYVVIAWAPISDEERGRRLEVGMRRYKQQQTLADWKGPGE